MASAAPFGGQPAFVIVYGVVKSGKTSDCIFSFPNAHYVALEAALKPGANVVGYEVPKNRITTVSRISDATQLLLKLPRNITEVVVDDFSLLAETTFSLLEKRYNGFRLFGELRDEVLEFRNAARATNRHVTVTCHESAPTQKSGALVRGGPRLPGRLPEDLPASCDLVLRTGIDPNRKGPWPGIYRCTASDPSYISGDRHGVTPDFAPMNLGEILRAAGYALSRAPGLDWMEPVVEGIATSLLAKPPDQEQAVINSAVNYMLTSCTNNKLHVRWALRDGIDRSILRRARSNVLSAFGVSI